MRVSFQPFSSANTQYTAGALRRAVLDGHPAARPQQPPRRALDDPDRVEAVGTGAQRGGRLVLADLRRNDRTDRNVRRVADHQVDGAVQVVQRGAEVPGMQR